VFDFVSETTRRETEAGGYKSGKGRGKRDAVPRLGTKNPECAGAPVAASAVAVRDTKYMAPGETYWSTLDPIWDAIKIDTPDVFAQTFGAIPRSIGLLYAAHFCQSEVCNGGFTQFFWNSTGVLAPEAVEGFMAIGQAQVANVVRRAMEMLGAPFQRDRAARWQALEVLRGEPNKEIQSGRPNYRNIALFGPLEDEFNSLLAREAGGFEIAADSYAAGISG
jgi:hypothetical protein